MGRSSGPILYRAVCQCESCPNRWKRAVMATSVPPNANTLSLLYKHAQWVQTLQPLGRRTSAQLQPPACLATGPPPQPSPSKCVDFSTHFIWKEKRAVGQGQPWPVQRPRRGSLKDVPCSMTTYLTEEAPCSPVMWFLHLKLSSVSECQCFRVCVSFFLAADGNLVVQQLCQVEPARFDIWTQDFLLFMPSLAL